MFNSAIFEHLQVKLDEDSQVREELRNTVQVMERQGVCHSTTCRLVLSLLKFQQIELQCQFSLEPIPYLRQSVSFSLHHVALFTTDPHE